MVKVVDFAKSERGPQRRRSGDNRALHCCCICGVLGVWGEGWTVFCSDRELDEGVAVPKFCSTRCKNKGGLDARNVTPEMRETAKNAEWREPRLAYRDATDQERYRAALNRQGREG